MVSAGFAAPRVAKLTRAVAVVPDALVATIRNSYVAPGFRPARLTVTGAAAVPEPASTVAVFESSDEEVPYSKR